MNEGQVIAFKERAGCPGGGKGLLCGYDHSFTLATNFNGAICYESPSSGNVYVMSERQISMMVTEDVSNTIAATDFKGSQVVCYEHDKLRESMGCTE